MDGTMSRDNDGQRKIAGKGQAKEEMRGGCRGGGRRYVEGPRDVDGDRKKENHGTTRFGRYRLQY